MPMEKIFQKFIVGLMDMILVNHVKFVNIM